MKYTGRFVRACAAGVATVALLAASSAQAETGKAAVRAVRGSATYSDAGGGWETLKVGKILKPGAKVRTEAGSQVDLFLGQNGPVVRVTESTTLGLDKLNFEETGADVVIETQLDLSSGRILGHVKKMAAASKYEVKTPVGVAGIRGTDYDISANGMIRVIDGSIVAVSSRPGVAPQVVNTGEQFNIGPGGGPRPEPIPPGLLQQIINDLPKPGPTDQGPIAGPITPPIPIVVNPVPLTDETVAQEKPYSAQP